MTAGPTPPSKSQPTHSVFRNVVRHSRLSHSKVVMGNRCQRASTLLAHRSIRQQSSSEKSCVHSLIYPKIPCPSKEKVQLNGHSLCFRCRSCGMVLRSV